MNSEKQYNDAELRGEHAEVRREKRCKLIISRSTLFIVHYSLFIIQCLFFGCDREDAWDVLKTRGERVVEERALADFRAITVKNGINVVLTQGNHQTATIEGWKNLMPKIRLSVKKNGELVMEDVNKCNFVRSRDNMTTVYLTFSGELDSIHFAGNGDIVTKDTIVISGLTVISEGSGNIDLKVKAQSLAIGVTHKNIASITIRGQGYSVGITNWGYSPVDVSGFKALYAGVAQNGSGNTYVNASESVDVGFYHGVGDVYYVGNPTSVTVTRNDKARGHLYQIP